MADSKLTTPTTTVQPGGAIEALESFNWQIGATITAMQELESQAKSTRAELEKTNEAARSSEAALTSGIEGGKSDSSDSIGAVVSTVARDLNQHAGRT